MPFTIPNEADALHRNMAEPDTGDLRILQEGLAGKGVLTGCAVAAQVTPDMTLVFAAGSVQFTPGVSVPVAGGNVTVTAADSAYPRFDLVVVSDAGVKSVIAGVPAPAEPGPVWPVWATTQLVVRSVYVPPAVSAVTNNHLTDKRVVLPGPQPANLQTGLSYTAAATDANRVVERSNAAANSFIIPPNSSVPYPLETVMGVEQVGVGTTTVLAGSGAVTIRSRGGLVNLAGQWAGATLRQRAVDEWTLLGDLA